MSRRHLWFALQAIGTIVLLTVLFRNFDWLRFWAVLRQMSPAFYAGSLMVLTLGQLLYAYRWRVVLSGMGIEVPYGELVRQYFMGVFFSNLMPTSVGGDAAKVYYLGQRSGYLQIGASVFLDRFLGFAWLAVIGASLAWVVGAGAPVLELNRRLLSLFALAFVSAIAVARLAPVERVLPRLVPARWSAWTARVGEFVVLVRQGACRPATVLTSGAVVGAYAWAITLVYQAHFTASGLVAATLPVMLVIISMSIFVNVPISVNGIGLREQLHALLFAAFGIPKEVAVTIALVLFAHTLILSLVGGAIWLGQRPEGSA